MLISEGSGIQIEILNKLYYWLPISYIFGLYAKII